ncbi:MAG TPA: complex I NDUFA9 subunit family protein [Gammaproteobacteria bacterium]|nr:complex I NDUFA9 subunit family protein [Gammaproteobacteria bacterium]
MSEHRICIMGGTGFVGRHLAARLNELQIPAKILTRRRDRQRAVLVLPLTQVVEINVYDYERLKKELVGYDTVINLVGILNESGHSGAGFHKTHVSLTRNVVDACISAGCKRLLHMSALNANSNHPSSFYLRTKGMAEDYVHTFARGIRATSFRPSVIFGDGDSFFNRFAGLLKLAPYYFPLACPDTRYAPVYVGDVVQQFIAALDNPATYGKRIELCGPETYTLRQLVEYTAEVLGLPRRIVGLPDFAAKLQANIMEYVPGKPFSRDNYHSMQKDNVCSSGIIAATSLKAVVPGYLLNRNTRNRYNLFRQEYGR